MIRKKHEIDTKLINYFLSEKKFDDSVNEALINWYSSLGDRDHQNTRNKAIIFLKKLSMEVLDEIDYPLMERETIIKTFEPLELLLRTALPLRNNEKKSESVRDHLSHTVRNILFTNYLLKKFEPDNSIRKQLFIAAIFHDLAYPIEKIKKVTKKLGEKTFQDLLNSKGEVEIELNNPDDLLNILDYVKQPHTAFINKIKDKEKEIIDKASYPVLEVEKLKEDLEKYRTILKKIDHIYIEIICKAIAGKGLFDASHSISSIIIFLNPIIKHWRGSKTYQEINIEKISDICLAMAYHDRSNYIQLISGFKLPLILKLMRIADELQEWDREQDSFIKDVEMIHETSTILSLKIIMKNKDSEDCKPEYFIPDKINGLIPIIENDESIKLSIEFPTKVDVNKLNVGLTNMKTLLNKNKIIVNYTVSEPLKKEKIEIIFNDSFADLPESLSKNNVIEELKKFETEFAAKDISVELDKNYIEEGKTIEILYHKSIAEIKIL